MTRVTTVSTTVGLLGVLLAMFAFFIGVALFAFWPGSATNRQDAADIPFRNDKNSEEQGDE